jgi:HD-like signal output (HDOD) protein
MLIKIFAYGLLTATVLRLALGARWKGLGVWFSRVIDTAIIVLGVCLVLNLVLVLSKS